MERSGVITASEPHWIAPFSGLQPHNLRRLIAVLRREGAVLTRRGRPWSLPLEDRIASRFRSVAAAHGCDIPVDDNELRTAISSEVRRLHELCRYQ